MAWQYVSSSLILRIKPDTQPDKQARHMSSFYQSKQSSSFSLLGKSNKWRLEIEKLVYSDNLIGKLDDLKSTAIS